MIRSLTPLALLLLAIPANAADWTHWRGPNQTGSTDAKNLPDEWDYRTVGKNNLIWKQPFGCRSTPLVMNDRVIIIGASGEVPGVPTQAEKLTIGERVAAFDAAKGTLLWEKKFNVFHTDIVTNRLGWAPIAGDAKDDLLYVHTTGGFLVCMKGATGDIVWQHSLTEEMGRVTGYGGRVGGGPIFDSGLCIVGVVNGSWGNQAIATNRWIAFDGKTGAVVWIAETPATGIKGTYYSNPVVAVINGERLLISGGADGGIHAFQVRTGKRVWSLALAANIVNPSPVVDGNRVFVSHGEDNITGGGLGKVLCLDAGVIVDGKPKLVWEYSKGIRWGLASMAIHDGKLYVPDDGAKLYCFDAAKGGKELWKYSYGTTSRGAPLIADGKLYISETNAKFHIIKLKEGKEAPDDAETHTTNFRGKGTGFVESNCTPSIGKGVIYLATRDELYCIGTGKGTEPSAGKEQDEPKDDQKIAQVAIFPAEVLLKPGEAAQFTVHAYTAKGQPLMMGPAITGEWSLPVPPLPKGATTPPPSLDAQVVKSGTVTPACTVTVNAKKAAQQGYVMFKTPEGLTAQARVRVAPDATLTYKQDFEIPPVGAVPGGWVNVQGKFRIVEEDGADGKKNKVLFKVNNDSRPPLARANAYITSPWATNYTIEADLRGTEADNKKGILPDMGIVAGRYTLILDGKTDEGKRHARLVSWEALPRINEGAELTWKSGAWYRVKLSYDVKDGKGHLKAKVWERGTAEPDKWLIEFTDPMPNPQGAAALYGYISNVDDTPGASIVYDNVVITPNGK